VRESRVLDPMRLNVTYPDTPVHPDDWVGWLGSPRRGMLTSPWPVWVVCPGNHSGSPYSEQGIVSENGLIQYDGTFPEPWFCLRTIPPEYR
jgi:hypothetical protein